MRWDMNKLSKWSKRTRKTHRERGLPLNVSVREILREAKRILEEDEGKCPICGYKMNQQENHPHQISLDYISPFEFQVICRDCNSFLGCHENRIVECCSK